MRATRRSPGPPTAMLVGVVVAVIAAAGARADEPTTTPPPATQGDLVKQANAPVSSILQLRLQDTYLPHFAEVDGQGNTLTAAMTMPLPAYRLLPRPQLSLLTMPVGVTTPDGSTGCGDLRFLDLVMFGSHPPFLWGVGPVFVFPTASLPTTGQAKWQLGPAAAVAYLPERWLIGVLAQNPISFAGDGTRADTNALFLQPFVTYQLGAGWFVRSQPQMFFNWKTNGRVVPLDLGAGRVFEIAGQPVSLFVEPFWNLTTDGPTPRYGITFGMVLLYPDFWARFRRGD